jgi:hypothetical protein
LLQQVGNGLFGVDGVFVAGVVQAQHNAKAGQLVGARAFDETEILDAHSAAYGIAAQGTDGHEAGPWIDRGRGNRGLAPSQDGQQS